MSRVIEPAASAPDFVELQREMTQHSHQYDVDVNPGVDRVGVNNFVSSFRSWCPNTQPVVAAKDMR